MTDIRVLPDRTEQDIDDEQPPARKGSGNKTTTAREVAVEYRPDGICMATYAIGLAMPGRVDR